MNPFSSAGMLCLGGILLVTCAGCVTKDPFGMKDRRGVDTVKTPVYEQPAEQSAGYAHVREAMQAAMGIETMDATAAMKFNDQRQNKSVRVNANILVARPDRMRLLASKVSKELMQMALVGESIDVWVADKQTLHRGNLRELTGGDMDFHPDEIIGQILFPVARFLSVPWIIVEETPEAVVVREKNPSGHESCLTIRTSDHALLKHEIHTSTGELWMSVDFSEHKPLPELKNVPPFPRRIIMAFPVDERELNIVLRKTTINPEVQPSDFWLLVPENGVTVKPLKRSMRLAEDALGESPTDDIPPSAPERAPVIEEQE